MTELDVNIRNGYYDNYEATQVPAHFATRAEMYRQVVHECLYNILGVYDPICTEITLWGLYDRAAWLDCYYPAMFDQGDTPHNPYYTQEHWSGHNATPRPTTTPGTPTPLVTPPVPKPAHRSAYVELLIAPPPEPPGFYPLPIVPTPVPTPNPYP